jgi:hypothetical protein
MAKFKKGQLYTGSKALKTSSDGRTQYEDFTQYEKDMRKNPFAPGLDRVKGKGIKTMHVKKQYPGTTGPNRA